MTYELKNAVWEITLKCNLKCFHCEFSAGKALSDELSTEEAIRLCDDLARLKCKRIILMGGELFLRKDWNIIAKKIKELGIELALITNGSIINKDIFTMLNKLNPFYIGVSLDGATAKTHDHIRGVKGSFNRALEFVDRCNRLQIPVNIVTSVHKLNIHELPKLRDILFDKNVLWEIQMTDIAGRFPREYLLDKKEFYSLGRFIHETQRLHPDGRKFVTGAHDIGYHSIFFPNVTGFSGWEGCQAGISLIAIESNGGIKGCSALTTTFVEDNIRQRNMVDIWKDPSSFAYNRQFNVDDLRGYCKNCKYGRSCKGGCIETSYMATGKIHCDPYCLHRIEELSLE